MMDDLRKDDVLKGITAKNEYLPSEIFEECSKRPTTTGEPVAGNTYKLFKSAHHFVLVKNAIVLIEMGLLLIFYFFILKFYNVYI